MMEGWNGWDSRTSGKAATEEDYEQHYGYEVGLQNQKARLACASLA